jgi:hypothetical protein
MSATTAAGDISVDCDATRSGVNGSFPCRTPAWRNFEPTRRAATDQLVLPLRPGYADEAAAASGRGAC